jgi:alkylation response protein AidB-like acyl-CoA dehydrogenase
MSKLLASETAMWVTTQAVQIFGGYGYIKDFPVERLFRDAKVTAARALLHATAAAKDRGESITQFSSMSKLLASEAAMWVTTQAVQIFGGYGYMKDFPVERLFRDAKVTEIYEGTSEIQRLVIARELYDTT